MRRSRLKASGSIGPAFYHCMSRVVDGRFIFGEEEKDRFVAFLREYEEFCGVHALTFCVMSNHFHILLEVPASPAVPPSADDILLKLTRLTGCVSVEIARQELKEIRGRAAGAAAAEREWVARYCRRMWDVSAFMKLLKQRFTQWYNRRTRRRGTLWEDRFRSVLVEGAGNTLVTMAAYIDLNPVRAGLVGDPKDYRWSGYGEAVAGRKRARMGLCRVGEALTGKPSPSGGASLAFYRVRLYTQGQVSKSTATGEETPPHGGFGHQEVLRVLASRGRLPLGAFLRCRVRYFSDGGALGAREFVEGVFLSHRSRFGPRRKTGARRLRGVQEPLYCLRDLQLRVFG